MNYFPPKIIRKCLEKRFVGNLIGLFVSEDIREREYLKAILHRVYGQFMSMRIFIRTSIANACFQTIYDPNRTENGIAEFLEIFCSIINGFSVPVKEEHKEFLQNVLMPLHKCSRLEKFYDQLVACCVQFFWPIQSPLKEEMFIAEVVNVINAMVTDKKEEFTIHARHPVFFAVITQLIRCMKSYHHSVAESATSVWSEEIMETLVDMYKERAWPKIIAVFIK
ncbi:serine/threonine protein phosphatase 2A B56 delta subunit, partial [Reticulomyxa filosa]